MSYTKNTASDSHVLVRTADSYLLDGKETPWRSTADAGCVIRWVKDRYPGDVRYVAETVTWRLK